MATSREGMSVASTVFNRTLFTKFALFKVNESRKPAEPITYMKHGQIVSLYALLDSDVLSILPTGYGKSLVFESIPHFASANGFRDIVVLLISPLNAIIEEQMCRLGEQATRASKENVNSLRQANTSFVVGHPEELLCDEVLSIFLSSKWQQKSVFIVVDEAHCVVQWGDNFRPMYREIRSLRAVFPSCRLLALTATAGHQMKTDIIQGLNMATATTTVRKSVDRSNIKLLVKKRPPITGADNTVENSYDFVFSPLVAELQTMRTCFPKTVVYSNLKWCGYAHNLALRPSLKGVPSSIQPAQVAQFHAIIQAHTKAKIVQQMREENGELRLLFATQAYSMGVDAPDIRKVIHAGAPRCMETYIQEIGRAGRDGKPAEAILFYNASDIGGNVVGMTSEVKSFCLLSTCRRDFLCNLFESERDINPLSDLHNCCDVCATSCRCVDCKEVDYH